MTRRFWPLLIGGVPFVMLAFALPLANRIEPTVLGLPFILFWIMLWIVLSPALLFLAYRIEKRTSVSDEEDEL